MTDWRPTSGPETARRRAGRLAAVRAFFADRGVLEVDVPALSRAANSDPNIESLVVEATAAANVPLFLQTSPEYAMKRLLAAGYPDIFSIARVFRDGEIGRKHEPEFTLIEWYRRDFDLETMAGETCELVAAVLDRPDLGTQSVRYRDAFSESLGIDPLGARPPELATLANADDDLRAALGEDKYAWLDLLLSTRVVPGFPADRLTVLTHYPASQAALARLDPGEPGVALRFEIFLGSVELANGYVELADVAEQRARFSAENAIRRRSGRSSGPVDERLLSALEHGLPDCAGVAVGFERLHMLYDGADDIADVVSFSFRNGK